MSHNDFLTKRLGKKVDYDGLYGYQCVDLAKQYMKEVHAIEPGIFGWSALTWYESGTPFSNNPAAWKKVAYASGLTPSTGDIIFRGPSGSNTYGHVAVVDSMVDASKVQVIEQNGLGWGTGTGKDAIRKMTYPLKGSLGRYRHHTPISNMDQAVIDIVLYNNGKLYNITQDTDLKNLLAATSKRIRQLYS